MKALLGIALQLLSSRAAAGRRRTSQLQYARSCDQDRAIGQRQVRRAKEAQIALTRSLAALRRLGMTGRAGAR